MVKVVATNKKTGEVLIIGYADTYEDAKVDLDENTEWDDIDVPEEWDFAIEEAGYEDCEPWDIDDDFGFDPYAGCYTYDC